MYNSVSLENNAFKLKNARLVSSYNGTRLPQISRGKTCTAASYAHQHWAFPDSSSPQFEHRLSVHSKEPKYSHSRYMPCAAANDNYNTAKNKYVNKDNRCDEVDMEVAYVKSQILDTILQEKCIENLPFPPSYLLALYPPSYQKELICYYYQLQKLYPDLYNQYIQYYEEYYKPVYMANGNTACVFQKGVFVPAATNSIAGGMNNSINQLGANGVVNPIINNNVNNNNSSNLISDKQQQELIKEQREELKEQQQLLKKLQKELLSNQKKQMQLIQKLAEEKSKERERDEEQRRLEVQRLQLRQQQQDKLAQALAAKNILPQTQTKAPNTTSNSNSNANKMVNKNDPSTGLSRQASNLSTTSLTRQSSIRRQNSMRRNEINKIQNEGGGLQRLPSMHK